MGTSWLHRPQQVGLRRALFQIHLWVALVLGIYIVVISLSGSAIVLRREFHRWLVPQSVSTAGVRLSGDALRAAIADTYPEHVITDISEQRRPERPVFVRLERNGEPDNRLFDPYAGTDMGPSNPTSLRFVEWLVRLHDNLLGGSTGRLINGIGALLVLVILLTGAVLWWPGKSRWWQGLTLSGRVNSLRFARQLHSFAGFWSFPLLLLWTVTAVYFAFPEAFELMIDRLDPDLEDSYRPGERLLYKGVNLHFGRFGGWQVRVLWVVLGLLPALLFVTGFLTWWKRRGGATGSANPGCRPAGPSGGG